MCPFAHRLHWVRGQKLFFSLIGHAPSIPLSVDPLSFGDQFQRNEREEHRCVPRARRAINLRKNRGRPSKKVIPVDAFCEEGAGILRKYSSTIFFPACYWRTDKRAPVFRPRRIVLHFRFLFSFFPPCFLLLFYLKAGRSSGEMGLSTSIPCK